LIRNRGVIVKKRKAFTKAKTIFFSKKLLYSTAAFFVVFGLALSGGIAEIRAELPARESKNEQAFSFI